MSDILFNIIIAVLLIGLVMFFALALISFVSAMIEIYEEYKDEK